MIRAKKYQKLPVIISALQWDGTKEGAERVMDWVNQNGGHAALLNAVPGTSIVSAICVQTLDNEGFVKPHDWMMRGTKGEFYPCQNDVFQETYVWVEDE